MRLVFLALLSCTTVVAAAACPQHRVLTLTAGAKTTVLDCTNSLQTPACAALEKAGGDPAKLEPKEGVMCTMQFDPVTATASGTWKGVPITFERTYGDACEMSAETGPVFAF